MHSWHTVTLCSVPHTCAQSYVYYWIFEYKSDKCLHYDPLAEELSHSTRAKKKRILSSGERNQFVFIQHRFPLALFPMSAFVSFFSARHTRTKNHSILPHSPNSIHFLFIVSRVIPCVCAHYAVATPFFDFYLFWIFQLIFFSLPLSAATCAPCHTAYACGDWSDVWRLLLLLYKSRKQSPGHLSFHFFFFYFWIVETPHANEIGRVEKKRRKKNRFSIKN